MKVFRLGRAHLSTRVPLLILFGLLGGAVNGLLGAGGGILAVLAMRIALRDTEVDTRDLYANALCVMLPISLFSCLRYAAAGNLSTEGFSRYALPALLGGLVGGFLLGRIPQRALRRLFAALVVYSGVVLLLR